MKATSKPKTSQSTEESTALYSSETANHTEADTHVVMGGTLEATSGEHVSMSSAEIQFAELSKDLGFLLK